VAIARALANDPEIIVGDEPTGNLDTVSTEQVFNILQDLSNQGRTVCVVTHDLGLAGRADRQIRLVDGKIEKISIQRKTAAVAQ
jgi:lipoprotein-releasing system ATP-binding protein